MSKYGIDVSKHQGVIDWGKVKATEIEFAILRCGFGDNLTKQDDPYFTKNVSECERLNIPYGIYLYSYATTDAQIQSEIEHVLRLAKTCNPKYPVYLDLENNSQIKKGKEWITNFAIKFCKEIKKAGYISGIYASQNWLTNYIDVTKLADYEIWIANYGNNNGNLNTLNYDGKYQMHQYTSKGKINGISGSVDMNICYKEYYTTQQNTEVKEETTSKIDVIYQTYTNGRWQPNVKNTEDYAGVLGMSVTGVYVNLSKGNITYKVHTKNGKWLPTVTDRKDYAGILGQPIDAIMIKSTKGKVKYRVHIKNGNWLPWVTGFSEKNSNNGFAGILGKEIDAIQIEIV